MSVHTPSRGNAEGSALTSCDDTFQAHHLAQMNASQGTWGDMVVSKTTTKTNIILLALDVVLERVM